MDGVTIRLYKDGEQPEPPFAGLPEIDGSGFTASASAQPVESVRHWSVWDGDVGMFSLDELRQYLEEPTAVLDHDTATVYVIR